MSRASWTFYSRLFSGVCVIHASIVQAQTPARWLGQSVKELAQGQCPSDLLMELSEAHKFSIRFSGNSLEASAKTGKLYGHVDGVMVKQAITAVSHLISSDGLLPWTAEKSELIFVDPEDVISMKHDIRTIAPLLTDPDQFLSVVTNSVEGVWEIVEMDAYSGTVVSVPKPASPEPSISNTAISVTRSNRTQAQIREVLEILTDEISRGVDAKRMPGKSGSIRLLQKSLQFKTAKLPVLDAFKEWLTNNDIPWLLKIPNDAALDLNTMVCLEKGRHRLLDVILSAAQALGLEVDVRGGVLVMAVINRELNCNYPRVYNIEKLLRHASPDDVADQIISMENVTTDSIEVLEPFLVVRTDFVSHLAIDARIRGNASIRETGNPLISLLSDDEEIEMLAEQDPRAVNAENSRSRSPRLNSPVQGGLMPNGVYARTENRTWSFDWEDVPMATKYHLIVKSSTARNAVIDLSDIQKSEHNDVSKGVVTKPYLRNWTWKVRAFVNGEWSDWSETRTFEVMEAK